MAKIPDHKPIKDLFESLLGRDVTIATQTEKVVPTARRACCVGTYMDGHGETRALVAADLELSARAGAALGLVPATGAATAIENKELPAALYDNFYEVLNIFSSLFFDDETGANLKLKTVYQPGMILPRAEAMQIRGLGSREDFTLDVDGYGTGSLGIIIPF
ncbi:hypothetical protein [Mobilicoccus massiliensis]|uniref:hypothetical protein n=1 Tax=Mobilicoccus massiliensis TaxID=1522310 RepID=UPI00058BB6EF|nr:hypothetical protein [Mobilicoccus massiliensis]